ncbi:MAG: hypothetical protein AAB686_00665 [Patescibacteria group bacterium]
MRLLEIPERLYAEFSDMFCRPEERRMISSVNTAFQGRELNQELTGFRGAIGIRTGRDGNGKLYYAEFALWGKGPPDKSNGWEPQPVLRVVSGFRSTGVWAAGRGEHTSEYAEVKLECPDARHPVIVLAAEMLKRSQELAAGSTEEKFWQVEKNPGGDFTSLD